MTDVSIKRNASGYYDETPYRAVFRGAQPGEIWKTTLGKEYLIVASHNSNMFTVLALYDQYKPDTIEVTSRQVMYTNPAMIQYLFGSNLTDFVKELPEDEFDAVVDAVSDALCINIKVNKVEVDDSEVETLKEIVKKQKEEMQSLRAQLNQNADELQLVAKERDHFKGQTETLMAASAANNDMGGMYQKMYYEVLDRLVMMAKG